MKIGINASPLYSGHRLRGIGYYTRNLLNYLKKDEELEVLEFTNLSQVKQLDLIHYPWFDFYFHTLPIIKKFKTIVTIHDTIPLLFPKHFPVGIRGKVNFYLQKIALKNVDAVITDSDISKKDIEKYLNLEKNKVFSIPLAVDEDFHILSDTALIRTRIKYHLPDKFILYVGDANWTKNLPFLINGFSRLIQKEQLTDLKLVLVGDVFLKKVEDINHPELESLKEVNRLIKRINLDGKIIRPGNLNKQDLVAFYNLATMYIQPSIYEGFGLPVLEALSCGTPVASSDRGSLPEVTGDAAIYFDPFDLSQFIKVTEEILTNKSLQKKLSDMALKHSLNFSWEKTIKQTKLVYSQVVKNE